MRVKMALTKDVSRARRYVSRNRRSIRVLKFMKREAHRAQRRALASGDGSWKLTGWDVY